MIFDKVTQRICWINNLIHNCVNTDIHSLLPWMKMQATVENKDKLWKTNTNKLKVPADIVKVKFRRKFFEQFGKRSFPEKPVAANMTSVVILSQRNKLSFVSAQISFPYFDGNTILIMYNIFYCYSICFSPVHIHGCTYII